MDLSEKRIDLGGRDGQVCSHGEGMSFLGSLGKRVVYKTLHMSSSKGLSLVTSGDLIFCKRLSSPLMGSSAS
jgi:hypothetical protein